MKLAAVRVAIWTDGHGAFRARCMDCSWQSRWYERKAAGQTPEERAVVEARVHGAVEHDAPERQEAVDA